MPSTTLHPHDAARFAATQVEPLRMHAQADDSDSEQPDALPPGTRLDEFELVRVLGAGGFGIVYLAMDHALLRQVAIKEYMPCELARRGEGSKVTLHSASHAHTFAAGLQSFIKEAQLLASFDHPSLVKVYRFWEGNGTAYMVMPYYAGRTLKEERRALGRAPDEDWLRRLVDPLLGALGAMHAQGVYHRDIAPDNIIIQPDGTPVLLDFGAARRVIGDRTQALTAVFKPNFAPVEQYADVPGMKQGPWTDLYALGAVVHYLLTGKPPVPAVVRAMHDHMPALSLPGAPVSGLSPAFAGAIDWALGVRSHERPQSAQALRDALDGVVVPPPPAPRLPEEAPASAAGAEAAATDSADAPSGSAGAAEVAVRTWDPSSPAASADGPTPPAESGSTTSASSDAGSPPTAAMAFVPAPSGMPPGDEPPSASPDGKAITHAPRDGTARLGPAAIAGIAAICALALGIVALSSLTHRQGSATPTAPSAEAVVRTAAPVAPRPAADDVAAPVTVAPKGTPPDASPRKPAARPARTAAPKSLAAAPVTTTDAAGSGTAATAADAPERSPSPPNPAPPRAAMTAPQSPREACGDRNFLSMTVCMNRQCHDPAFAKHAQCIEFRSYEEARRQAESQR